MRRQTVFLLSALLGQTTHACVAGRPNHSGNKSFTEILDLSTEIPMCNVCFHIAVFLHLFNLGVLESSPLLSASNRVAENDVINKELLFGSSYVSD